MIDFTFTEEQRMLRDVAKRFADQELRPQAALADEREEISMDLIRKAGELGFLGVVFPEEYGGGGFGEVGYCLMLEELSRGCTSTTVTIGGHESLGAMAIYLAGSEEQKQKYLRPLAEGKRLAMYALTEPGAGSDVAAMRTAATRNASGWVLDGNKTFITNGNIADIAVVFAMHDASAKTRGMTAFIVETAWEGFRAGKPEKKMGIRGSHTTDLFFEDLHVPEANVLGGVGEGFKVAMRTLDVARVSLAAQCLGGAKELLDLSIVHANTRRQFGKPIGEQEAVQMMLAQMATEVFQIESIVYRTAAMIDNTMSINPWGPMCKLAASEALCRVADIAVQIHGGMGYMRDYPIERLYRDARVTRIFEGTNEIQQFVIAREILKQGVYEQPITV